MKKLSIVLLSLFSFFFCFNRVYANKINSIDMDIYIDEYGSAYITEIWDVYLNKGTEGYKSFSDMGNAYISNFKVSDDTGVFYQYQNVWNIDLSFDDKKYKNGIYQNFNGVDLCWGISNYGKRIYNLSYKINNFVNNYNDTQGIYFKLLKLDQNVKTVNIKIRSYIPLNIDNSKIWGFGYDGTINFKSNDVYIDAKSLNISEYVALLMKFENNIYTTNNYINMNFDEVYEEAMKDAKNRKSFIEQFINSHPYLSVIIFFVLFFILVNIIRYINALFITLISIFLENILPNNNFEYINSIKKIKRNRNNIYYRDIPCNKDIEIAFYILNKLNIIKAKNLKKGILGAYILKWIKLGYIKVDKENKSLIINKDIYSSLSKKELSLDSKYETKLYIILYEATNNDGILKSNEFKKWSRKNYKILNNWYEGVLISKKNSLENKNLIIDICEKDTKKGYSLYYKEFSDELMQEAYNLIGLKKFLLDFSNIKDRSMIEVELWEYYIIFATLFDITNKVDDELKNLYPDLNIDNYIKFNDILKMIDEFSESSYRGMKTSININNFRSGFNKKLSSNSNNSSSGGGGSSFSSGGSSSGGSSGGGFR